MVAMAVERQAELLETHSQHLSMPSVASAHISTYTAIDM